MVMGTQKTTFLRCPVCGGDLVGAKDSRPGTIHGLPVIKRLRLCHGCGTKQTTIEIPREHLIGLATHLRTVKLAEISAMQAQMAKAAADLAALDGGSAP
jgi:transcriptional regulator NrdR family protein